MGERGYKYANDPAEGSGRMAYQERQRSDLWNGDVSGSFGRWIMGKFTINALQNQKSFQYSVTVAGLCLLVGSGAVRV